MSDILRSHIKDFGFTHTEIARRASKLNQATTYRVVEGETQNPSLNSNGPIFFFVSSSIRVSPFTLRHCCSICRNKAVT